MLNPVHVSRIRKNGRSLYLVIPGSLLRSTILREGDAVALRQAGDKLILERVALEDLAKIRTGEQEARAS